MELQMFTIVGASKKATLLTRADAAQLRALQETDLRFIRVGYDSDGNWLTIDLGNGELFFCNDEYRPSDVIRTPIETVMNWAPTTERLLLLTQRLKRGELSEQELPRKRYTPTFEEMIKWVLYVKEGLVTREDVSDWAGRVLQQSDDDLIVGMTTDSLVWLNGIDLPDGDSGYLHDESDLDEWVLQLERKIDEL